MIKSMGKIDPVLMQLITDLVPMQKNWHEICDFFAVPETERSESWVAQAIIERIKQYLTAYTVRKSLNDRATGAAFRKPDTSVIVDPIPIPTANEQG